MATNRYYSKTKLAAGSQERKRWNAAARLYSVAMGQIRSTERISSFKLRSIMSGMFFSCFCIF